MFSLLKVEFYVGVVVSTISMVSLIGTFFPFLWMGALTDTFSAMLSYFLDALVIGLLALTLSAVGGEENNNILSLRRVALAERVSTGLGAGKGETSLCRD